MILAATSTSTLPHPSITCETQAMQTSQIMSSPVVGVSPVASVPRVVGLLRTTSHNGFPVLAPPEDLGDGSSSLGPDGRPRRGRRKRGPRRLLGMILRSQLLVLLERGAFCDAEGASCCLVRAPLAVIRRQDVGFRKVVLQHALAISATTVMLMRSSTCHLADHSLQMARVDSGAGMHQTDMMTNAARP